MILWRRLDTAGHDACRLERSGDGWIVEGTAVFSREGVPARLDYRVRCDARWQTRVGRVRGWIGSRSVRLRIERAPDGSWSLDGDAVPGLEGCMDLDLGFTPATNLLPIRRLALPRG